MAKKKSSEEKPELTHTLDEVDRLTAESYIDGYAGGFNIFMGACEKSLKALNDVMGFYMIDDLSKFDDRVRELHLAHNAIRFAMEQMADAYDEHMVELKDLWNLEDYIANID